MSLQLNSLIYLSLAWMISSYAYVLEFNDHKEKLGPLAIPFLEMLSKSFGGEVFIETGTWEGETTKRAAEFFKEVHSVELSQDVFAQTGEKLRSYENIHLYQGDSGVLLPQMIEKSKGRIVFWLDAHNSGGLSAKGEKNAPIIEELMAIRKSGKKNSIILVDDIRYFDVFNKYIYDHNQTGYPDVNSLCNLILKINPAYKIVVYGDCLMALPDDILVEPSPLINALTVSRLYNGTNYTDAEIVAAEHIIATAPAYVFEVFDYLERSLHIYNWGIAKHYAYWKFLMLMNKDEINKTECLQILNRVIDEGLHFPHILKKQEMVLSK